MQVYIVVTKEQRVEIEEPVKVSFNCFSKRKARELEDEIDKKKDMESIMKQLEDLEKGLLLLFDQIQHYLIRMLKCYCNEHGWRSWEMRRYATI